VRGWHRSFDSALDVLALLVGKVEIADLLVLLAHKIHLLILSSVCGDTTTL